MLDPQAVEAMILEKASQDAYGLYEVVRAVHERYPSASEAAAVAAAQTALRALIDAGKIRLYWERWATSMPLEEVAAEHVAKVLDNPVAWRSGSRYVCFAAPDAPGRAE